CAGRAGEAVERGLDTFTGAGRRFEKKGVYNGADVYDDYAHHPDELRALLTMAGTLGYQRVVCAFQPHTYTRTAALFDGFVDALKLAGLTVLAPIYAARETDTLGMSSQRLAQEIPGAVCLDSLEETGGTWQNRPARRPDSHSGRGGHLSGRGDYAGEELTFAKPFRYLQGLAGMLK
ncbi:hypothetical protein AOA80_07110, partial [Methanomassiliicoccales archaeon RumEn M1]